MVPVGHSFSFLGPPPQGSPSWPLHANLGGGGIFLRTELVRLGKLEKLIHVIMCFAYNIKEEFEEFFLLIGRYCVYFLGLQMHILFHVNNYKVKVYTGYGVIIPALGGQRKEDCCKVEASLSYTGLFKPSV